MLQRELVVLDEQIDHIRLAIDDQRLDARYRLCTGYVSCNMQLLFSFFFSYLFISVVIFTTDYPGVSAFDRRKVPDLTCVVD